MFPYHTNIYSSAILPIFHFNYYEPNQALKDGINTRSKSLLVRNERIELEVYVQIKF